MSTPNDTPTPRSDAAYYVVKSDGKEINMVKADFARTLERELAAVTAERDALRLALSKSCDGERERSISEGLGHSTCGLADELTRERDQLRADLAQARQTIEDVCCGTRIICETCGKPRPCCCHDLGETK